jgi:hypothetical protein
VRVDGLHVVDGVLTVFGTEPRRQRINTHALDGIVALVWQFVFFSSKSWPFCSLRHSGLLPLKGESAQVTTKHTSKVRIMQL